MSWRDKIEELRERLFGNRDAPGAPSLPVANVRPADRMRPGNACGTAPSVVTLNLGIDFGTSFTKVCYRDLGTEESGVVAIGPGLKSALLPSVVAISQDGRLSLRDGSVSHPNSVEVTYLKMRLAGTPITDDLTELAGIKLNEPATVKALAAWFLASVIVRSQRWVGLNESDRLKNRTPIWSANVGVPVEHYDSDALATFEEVLGVAWLWVKDVKIPGTLRAALDDYSAVFARLEREVTDFHAVPEIAAAVQSFVMSREAVPGIYVYFDIGGGTIDGVAFNYVNYDGERRINFYSGRVEALGISAIGAAIDSENRGEFDASLLEMLLKECAADVRDDYENRIRCLVGTIIITAKKKDGRNWQVDAIQNADYERKFIGQLPLHRMKPLVIFLGGGGSRSQWYGSTISSTYTELQHDRAGIPPYKMLNVQRPTELALREGDDFTRFAISYGLSIPFGEGPEIRLPSRFKEAEPPKVWRPRDWVDYADSKDVYD
ncbi:hypothetical protein [Bradyrhizobium sp. SZCCHNPS1003]|uniref:hypothetical protein n=1 Tax=Bradyrhizobium sp. SZCCHNPS1003 TaxID=3057330 RepID=UPI0028ED3DB7|nr:hypothetical protein [Bradyrhizobium sp. SZCCHNPS1003]